MLEKIPHTLADGLTIYHPDVERLGPNVGETVIELIRVYARRASLTDIPPVTLSGKAWGAPWESIAASRCGGDAGASYEESRRGIDYRCLALMLFDQPPPRDPRPPEHQRDIEGTIAHEVTHLRWWNLQHGPEFSARVRAPLKGATFPPHTSWKAETRQVMATTRQEMREWLETLLGHSWDAPGQALQESQTPAGPGTVRRE